MLTITCVLDQELSGVPGEGLDPLGSMAISDENSVIEINNTYLDSWLAGLIDGLRQLKTKSHVRIETEEREPIDLDMGPDGRVVISRQDQKVVARGPKELETALRVATHRFLRELRDSPDASRNQILDPIRKFWLTTEN